VRPYLDVTMERLVRDIMKIGVPTCNLDALLPEVAKIMARENADTLIVMDEFGAAGVVSQSDLVKAYSRNYQLLAAKDVMTDKIISITPESPLTAATNLMQDDQVHQLFIMHEHPGPSRPSAVVTMRAIVREMAGLAPERLEMKKTRGPAKKTTSNKSS
jgi:CBS domain-containing protein